MIASNIIIGILPIAVSGATIVFAVLYVKTSYFPVGLYGLRDNRRFCPYWGIVVLHATSGH